MGQCEYVNEEKSGPWNGWYCNIAGKSVDSSLHRNYCNSSVSCKYCPLRGGDDRYRNSSRPDPTPEPKSSYTPSYYSDDSTSSHSGSTSSSYSSGGGGGGLGCLDRIFFGGIAFVLGGFVLFLAGTALLSMLGFFREDVAVKLHTPSGINPRHFAMEVVSHNPKKDYKVKTDKLDKEGSAEIRMHMGMNSVYLIFDDQKFSLTDNALNGEAEATLDVDYNQVQDVLCRIVWMELQGPDGAPISTDSITVLDEVGESMLWMPVEDGQIMVVLPERWSGDTVTLTAEGFAPVSMEVSTKERISGMTVRLKPEN